MAGTPILGHFLCSISLRFLWFLCIDSFVAKVWRNVRGQYQFKTAEVTSDLSAAVFFGRIDLYSVHWVHEANRNLASSRCYSDVAIVHHSRFCKANRNMVPGSPARTKITVALEVVIHVSAVTPVAVTYHSSNLCRTSYHASLSSMKKTSL